jgi:hypothetical protein
MIPESPSSESHLDCSHDRIDYKTDTNFRSTTTQRHAVAVEDISGSDDAAEKQWRTKWKKKGVGFSFLRTAYKWKLEFLALLVVALILASEVRRLSLDRSSFTSTSTPLLLVSQLPL